MNERIKIRMLNIAFINKNFIKDNNNTNDKYNYEKYLLEFVNYSKIVSDNYGEKFNYNINQYNGECDITNGYYDLDFKLLVPTDTVITLNQYSNIINVDANGGVLLSDCKKHGKYQIYNYLGLLNNLTVEDILEIEMKKVGITKIDSLIKKIIKNIKINKNVLYYLPVEVIISENVDYNNYLNFVASKFYDYLIAIMNYRNTIVRKDSFLCFLAQNNMIFLKLKENKFILYDIINMNCSDLFMKINDMITIW